jgi:hypothetical protein
VSADSLPSKLFDAFIKSFTSTFRELVLHVILGVATIAYGIRSQGFTHIFWDVVVPLAWLVCIEVVWHILKAARLLSNESIGGPVPSAIFTAGGKRFERAAEPTPFYRTKIWTLASLVVVGCVLFAVLVRVVASDSSPMPQPLAQPSPPPPAQAEQPPPHTLLVRYTRAMLPLRIAPHDTAYILQLNPNIPEWVWEVPNNRNTAITWPPGFHPKKGEPPGDAIYACELTNDEDKTLLDVSVSFHVSFHELEMVPVTVTKNKDGTESLTVTGPGRDHVVVTVRNPKNPNVVTAAQDGAVVKEFMHSISIPSIEPGSTARVYLISQSKFISKFALPVKATAIVSGNATRIQVTLVRPNVTPMDSFAWWGLAPSTYHWEGIPGSP